ncbi:enoyl-CoA hydratase [Novosphingobium hassiacum]|uniref:Enoyl-CoA hydratase n=1 Tax=Novosphingobium hassiacum TaxID=173676 RepID=A0A7W5ZZZ8_9SPHN|nr:enoyl-CoA hydratase [Novosphingobium hassiacum]
MADIETDLVVQDLTPQIVVVRLNRPDRLNALTRETVMALNDTLDSIAARDEVRAVILTGTGRGFCSGQDVAAADARNRTAPSGLVERMFWQEQFAGMVARIRAMPQVVIAAVNGPCAGAGMALALAADMRLASRSAKFLNAAVRLGLTAGETGMSYMLPRLIGASRAFEILITGRPVLAEEALAIGLVVSLSDGDTLMNDAEALARQILANSPFATKHTKRIFWENLHAPSFGAALELENRTQILASMTDDYKEATAAFTDRRVPDFKGR